MKFTAPLIHVAVLSLALSGGALAQSSDVDPRKAHEAVGSHDAMGAKASDSSEMKKMNHVAGSEGHERKTSGHAHGGHKTTGDEVPADLDTATAKLSDHEHYRVSIAPEAEPVVINTLHNWVLEIMTPDGKPVEKAEVSLDGGMPAHGHGLPTAPQVTEYLGDGKYLIEGVRFNMAGWWQVSFTINGHHADTTRFNIIAN